MKELQARIFLSDNRAVQQSNAYRAYESFVNNSVPDVALQSQLILQALKDVELLPNAARQIFADEDQYLVLLPITGDLIVQSKAAAHEKVDVGEIRILTLKKGDVCLLKNPFEKGIINFLEMKIAAQGALAINELLSFQLQNNNISKLSKAGLPFKLSIGRFTGREKGNYQLNSINNILYTFVIAGAFEVEDRLLQMRDGLQLSYTDTIDFEALSNDAILLFIESAGNQP